MDNIVIVHTPSITKVIKACDKGTINSKEYNDIYWMYPTRLTLVGIPNIKDNLLSIGLSICSYPDNFNKKRGRELATKRAMENPIQVNHYNKDKYLVSDYKFLVSELQKLHSEIASDVNKYKKLLSVTNKV